MVSRFCIREEVAPIAQELLELTCLNSYSDLASLMFSRYGRHLKATWEVSPQTPIATQQNNAFAPAPLPIEPIAEFSDSIEL